MLDALGRTRARAAAVLALAAAGGVRAQNPSPPPIVPSAGFVNTAGTLVATLAGKANTGATSAAAVDGVGTSAEFFRPRGMAITSDGSTVYFTEGNLNAPTFNHYIRVLDTATRAVTTLVGNGNRAHFRQSGWADDGTGTNAKMGEPCGMVITSDDSTLYVSEHYSQRIRKVVIATRVVTTRTAVTNSAGV